LEQFRVKSRQQRRSFGFPISRAIIFFLACACLNHAGAAAQSSSDNTETIRGVVINSVTREPIDRALVSSPDRRFATLTNSEGRFEFSYSRGDASGDDTRPNNAGSDRPYALIPSKPGFLPDPNTQGMNNIQEGAPKDLALVLVPQAVIAGTVSLPTSEAPDSITLQIYRKQIQDGRSSWVPVGASQSMSDGQFRFADLPAGSYKLLTTELLDTDPLTTDPRGVNADDPFDSNGRGRLFGYPPVYYQGATDFASASTIELAAGQTQTTNISLVKQPYYRVKVPVLVPSTVPEIVPGSPQAGRGFGVNVYPGHKGPGFSLGYNPRDQAIEGMLPSGTYTVEVASFQPNGAALMGIQTFAIKGAPISGPSIGLVSGASIAVNVKEEFTGEDHSGGMSFSANGRTSAVKGPRRYLNVALEPVDNFGMERQVSLRDPTRSGDEAMVLEGVPPGRYWVRIYPFRGYPASIHSGAIDLLHQPLEVGLGGATSPIEITMRDDTAEISGTVEGLVPSAQGTAGSRAGGDSALLPSSGHVLCVPLADSAGQFSDIGVKPDGSFESQGLAPGSYRLLAFDQPTEIEYRNPEAMKTYDSKGPVVRVAAGQKEHVTLQLMSRNPKTE
jgi:hypothetical protein